jgi:hypothetical protein
MQVVSGYSWERICRAAENEPDPLKLRDRIREAEQTLSARSRELRRCSDGDVETRAVREAADRLRFIATERLGPAER